MSRHQTVTPGHPFLWGHCEVPLGTEAIQDNFATLDCFGRFAASQ